MDALPDALLIVGAEGRIVLSNAQADGLFGYGPGELVGRRIEDLIPERFRSRHRSHRGRYATAPRTRLMGCGLALAARRSDGTEFAVDISLNPAALDGREVVFVHVRGMSESSGREQALRHIVDDAPGTQEQSFFEALVEHVAKALGARGALVGVFSTSSDDTVETLAVWARDAPAKNFSFRLGSGCCENGVAEIASHLPSEVQRKFGAESGRGVPLFNSAGQPLGVLAVLDDKPSVRPVLEVALLGVWAARAVAELERLTAETARAEAEGVRREANERFELAARAVRAAVYDWDVAGERGYLTQGFADVFGLEPGDIEATDAWWLGRIHPDDRERATRAYRRSLHTGREYAAQYRFRAQDDGYRHVIDRALALRDGDGHVVRMVGGLVDVTERVQIAEQLRQAQKLEALGRLAAGIAHDFNNVLAAVTGYAELVLRRLGEEDVNRTDVEEILKAGQRASSLTRRLLAYGRKEMLQPEEVDVDALILELDPMLRRMSGEDVELVCRLDSAGRVLADPGQLEQVIVNLAGNAHDAMPAGGRLRIETRAVVLDDVCLEVRSGADPGPYVQLIVSDTGVGMDEEVCSRIFEPLFTTKGAAGTGLGLATVYGIVTQSGGHIAVESKPGRGTTFKICLPRIDVAPDSSREGGQDVATARRASRARGR
jgi:PAS domain S-box-containing protein